MVESEFLVLVSVLLAGVWVRSCQFVFSLISSAETSVHLDKLFPIFNLPALSLAKDAHLKVTEYFIWYTDACNYNKPE